MLADDRIYLRAIEQSDIDTLYEWENLSELWHTSATLAPYSRHNLRRYVETYEANPFATGELRLIAAERATGESVGFVDMYGIEVRHRRANIGILIAPSHQRKGYAGRVLRLLETYAGRHLQLRQLLAAVPVYNTASLALFASAGYNPIAVLPEYIAAARDFYDAQLFRKVLP